MESNDSAYVPDLPGCIATGSTIEETESLIKEAIAFHLEGMREDHQTRPGTDESCGICFYLKVLLLTWLQVDRLEPEQSEGEYTFWISSNLSLFHVPYSSSETVFYRPEMSEKLRADPTFCLVLALRFRILNQRVGRSFFPRPTNPPPVYKLPLFIS